MNVRRNLELLLSACFGVAKDEIYEGVRLTDLGLKRGDVPKLCDRVWLELDIKVPNRELTEELTFQELVNTVEQYS